MMQLKVLKHTIKIVRSYTEQPQSGLLQEENYRIQLKIATIFDELKMYRKAAFHIKNVI